MSYDYLIRNCRWPDFEAGCFQNGDVAVTKSRIAAVSGHLTGDTKQVIEANGRILSPGFIDIHMHEENFAADGKQLFISKQMSRMGVTTCVGGNCGVSRQPLEAFKSALGELGTPVNYLMLTGYNRARRKAGGTRYGAVSMGQAKQIEQMLREDLAEGAIGISFGIEYDPGMTTGEIVDILRRFPDGGLMVSIHYRDDASNSLKSIREMREIARESRKRVQISHLSSCAAMGQMKEALALIDEGMAAGEDINFDTYPYDAFQTPLGSAVYNDDCFEHLNIGYSDVMVSSGEFKGQRCDKELFERLRKEQPDTQAVCFAMWESDIALAVAHSGGMIGSDGSLVSGAGHPRAAGTFPRVLGLYVRERRQISLLEALRKMTVRPARRLGLSKKGAIAEGMDADLTLFDPETVMDRADFTQSSLPPVGIDWVFVSGIPTVAEGTESGAHPGRFIPYAETDFGAHTGSANILK